MKNSIGLPFKCRQSSCGIWDQQDSTAASALSLPALSGGW
jgi:hypothetical protein